METRIKKISIKELDKSLCLINETSKKLDKSLCLINEASKKIKEIVGCVVTIKQNSQKDDIVDIVWNEYKSFIQIDKNTKKIVYWQGIFNSFELNKLQDLFEI